MKNQQLEFRSQLYGRTLLITIVASLIVILAIVLVVRYRMQVQRQEKRQLQQEAARQKAQLHQTNEVVAFLCIRLTKWWHSCKTLSSNAQRP